MTPTPPLTPGSETARAIYEVWSGYPFVHLPAVPAWDVAASVVTVVSHLHLRAGWPTSIVTGTWASQRDIAEAFAARGVDPIAAAASGLHLIHPDHLGQRSVGLLVIPEADGIDPHRFREAAPKWSSIVAYGTGGYIDTIGDVLATPPPIDGDTWLAEIDERRGDVPLDVVLAGASVSESRRARARDRGPEPPTR